MSSVPPKKSEFNQIFENEEYFAKLELAHPHPFKQDTMGQFLANSPKVPEAPPTTTTPTNELAGEGDDNENKSVSSKGADGDEDEAASVGESTIATSIEDLDGLEGLNLAAEDDQKENAVLANSPNGSPVLAPTTATTRAKFTTDELCSDPDPEICIPALRLKAFEAEFKAVTLEEKVANLLEENAAMKITLADLEAANRDLQVTLDRLFGEREKAVPEVVPEDTEEERDERLAKLFARVDKQIAENNKAIQTCRDFRAFAEKFNRQLDVMKKIADTPYEVYRGD